MFNFFKKLRGGGDHNDDNNKEPTESACVDAAPEDNEADATPFSATEESAETSSGIAIAPETAAEDADAPPPPPPPPPPPEEAGLPLQSVITEEDILLTPRFAIGMKLEALDKMYPGWGCGPATIKDIKEGKLLISFDGWSDRYDQWARPTDTDLAPIGATQALGMNMHPPKGHPPDTPFDWIGYLGDMSNAVPLDAFGDRPLANCFHGRPIQKVKDPNPAVFETVYGVPYEMAMESLVACDQLTKFAGKSL